MEAWEQLRDALHRRLAHAHEGLNFQIERAAEGELPRFELKAKRMVDLRESPVAGQAANAPTPAGTAP